jgi:phosphate transport system permease protein
LSTQHQDIATVRPIAYGTALVLIALVLSLNMVAVLIRYHYRKKARMAQ